MKKEIKSFILALSLVSIPGVVMANELDETSGKSGWLSLWVNEDEEDAIRKPSASDEYDSYTQKSSSKSQKNYRYSNENSEDDNKSRYYRVDGSNGGGYGYGSTSSQTRVRRTKRVSNTTYRNGSNEMDYQSPLYFVPSDNNAYNIDYDTYQAERSSNNEEVANSIDKWRNGVTNVFWENYRGNNIRIEMLRNNRDLKEMRLKFVQSQSMTSDPDGSISDILNVVADRVMKRTCGKKSKQSVILYERPSVELERETAADNYKIMAKGTSLKEYGFRCIY